MTITTRGTPPPPASQEPGARDDGPGALLQGFHGEPATAPAPAAPATERLTTGRRDALVAGGLAVALIAGGVFFLTTQRAYQGGVGGLVGVSCTNNLAADTAALTNAVAGGGTVSIAAGTCALNSHIPVNKAVDITGAGSTLTYVVQHAHSNIFQINVPGVTVENMNLDTYTYNQWAVSTGNPNPATLFSASSHTTLRNLVSKSNVGFGMRVTGPNPCDTYQTTGTVVQNVTSTNYGHGGFTALDIDCTNGASLSNVTIHGDYIALYQDENVTINGESYQRTTQNTCTPPVYITGAAYNIAMSNINGGGSIIEKTAPLTNITQTNVVRLPAC